MVREGQPSGGRARRPPARLLDEDPELGEDLDPARRLRAGQELLVRTVLLSRGDDWQQLDWPSALKHGAGLLVLSGVLLRRIWLDGRYGAELLGPGDLLRPWQREDAAASIPRQDGWHVLSPARKAILDLAFLQRSTAYPEISAALMGRALRRSRNLAVHMAIVHHPRVETRLRMLFWHLADRWGVMRSDGVTVPLKGLTHSLLADLVAAQRPTVSAALGSLEKQGTIVRMSSGYRLHGSPPVEMLDLAAGQRPPVGAKAPLADTKSH